MDPVELLKGLVSIPSPSTEEAAAVAFLVDGMKAQGMQAYTDNAGNAIGTLGDGPRDIVLLGHIDTFHGWVPVRIEQGQLFGRGSVDAKGCLAAFVSACDRVGARPGTRFVVIGAVEEESATSKGARFAAGQYHPEYCVVGEPSGWERITLGYKGRVLVDCEIAKEVSHTAGTARPSTEEAVEFWQKVVQIAREYNQDKARLFEQLDVSLRSINSSDDGLIDRVNMRIGIRVPMGLDIDSVKSMVAGQADGARLAFSSEEPPFRADKNNAEVRAFLSAIREHGGQPAFALKTGTADMNIVGPEWKCPIVAYGPGDSSLDHTPNEHLDLAEYQRAIDVLSTVLLDLARRD